MPTYEYSCDSCHGQFEYFQGMSAPAKTQCEKCGGHLNRLVGAGSGLVFKGSGFYITDYKASPAPSGSGESGTSGTSASTPSSSTSGEGSSSSSASASPAPSTPTTTPAKE